jgi:small subunit ribosomal protein S20
LAKKKSSAEKRHRQSEARRLQNKAAKSAVRTSVKKFVALAQKKGISESEIAESGLALREMVKKIDTAARKGIIKKNAAARKKSRMQKFFNALRARPAGAAQ